jgi:hypothetical protein
MTCNLPPFPVANAYATAIVDFKLMRAIQDGSVGVPGPWVLGFRPKLHMQKNPSMYIKYAPMIRQFYTKLPKYVPDYTKLSCGHMACHFLSTKFRPDTVHMYGFDSIFNFDLGSASDLFLESSRDDQNNARLTRDWRGIWPNMFKEFPSTEFVLHGPHMDVKIPKPENLTITTK